MQRQLSPRGQIKEIYDHPPESLISQVAIRMNCYSRGPFAISWPSSQRKRLDCGQDELRGLGNTLKVS